MSAPPDARQRLAAISNCSGGRSSAFMLHHLLEPDDGRPQAKRPWSQATLWQRPWQLFLVLKREKPPLWRQTSAIHSAAPDDETADDSSRALRPAVSATC